MDFFNELTSQGRRALVDATSFGAIERSSPWSPDVDAELRHAMPDLFDRFPINWPWTPIKLIDPALHSVWILDNTAFRDSNSGWKAEFVAAYFIKNSGKDVSRVVSTILDFVDLKADDVTRQRVAKRLQPFVDTVLPKRTIDVSVDGKARLELGPSSQSGISSKVYDLQIQPSAPAVQTAAFDLPPPFGLPATTHFAAPTGWAILSDIDDTIKVTQTPSPVGVLTNTFCVETPQPISGMPELYAHLNKLLASKNPNNESPPFFYLSASPYNLYPFLRTFLTTNYPSGTTILRDASWQNLGGLITSLSQGTNEYKTDRITKVHSWLPGRKFILIGDSTQSDPEAYGNAARAFPEWVGAIFIRKVTGIAEMNENEKNSSGRFEKAFKGVDRRLWYVFEKPGEVAERIEGMMGGS
nr:hypothetical protein B0A51_00289 [Rachicladosporium sp. CCFEE 5018]